MPLRSVPFDALVVDDEASFRHVALYAALKRVVRASGKRFLVPEQGTRLSWDRAVFLNLTYWGAQDADVLCDEHIAADVVTHVAWHHLAAQALSSDASAPSPEALFFGEAIASAFDLYLVGRLLPNVSDADFIVSQVPVMHEAADEAGLDETEFAALMTEVTEAPERSFEAVRSLLFDSASALYGCADAGAAQVVLERFGAHRFAPLLHHYQLSNWVLYARAYARPNEPEAALVRALDAELRAAPDALALLEQRWLRG